MKKKTAVKKVKAPFSSQGKRLLCQACLCRAVWVESKCEKCWWCDPKGKATEKTVEYAHKQFVHSNKKLKPSEKLKGTYAEAVW